MLHVCIACSIAEKNDNMHRYMYIHVVRLFKWSTVYTLYNYTCHPFPKYKDLSSAEAN